MVNQVGTKANRGISSINHGDCRCHTSPRSRVDRLGLSGGHEALRRSQTRNSERCPARNRFLESQLGEAIHALPSFRGVAFVGCGGVSCREARRSCPSAAQGIEEESDGGRDIEGIGSAPHRQREVDVADI